MMAGAFAGLANSMIVGPVELIKCKMQDHRLNFSTSKDCLNHVIKTEGIRGLFKGMFATVSREVPGYAGQFAVY